MLPKDAGLTTLSRFASYVSSVETVATDALGPALHRPPERDLSELLNGQAGLRLRETVPLCIRRESGAFFSNSGVRSAALNHWSVENARFGTVLDPTVGAGDLLIEFAQYLPIDPDLATTLQQWGDLIHGRDLEPSFVRLAKARLVLLAVSRGATPQRDNYLRWDEVFPEIQVGDGLAYLKNGWPQGHLFMNPPFIYEEAPQEVTWAKGRTNLAATFLSAAMENAQPGTCLTAILPEVIRSGSSYERLRSLIAARLEFPQVEVYGRFDAWTDADVFFLRGVIRDWIPSGDSWPWWRQRDGKTFGDQFDVSVGPVVPHRNLETGPLQPFLLARRLPLGGSFDVRNAEKRRFQRRTSRPPFVVVRRTSRPGDAARGVGTLICGNEDVLVENHLLVLQPKDGSVEACRSAIEKLESTLAGEWLDERIRCRHLTVRVLREMPWFEP